MSDVSKRNAFIRSIAKNVYDDVPRLVFADWLDDHDEPELAELICLQIELEPMRDQYEIPRAKELHDRENQLLRTGIWRNEMPEEWQDWQACLSLDCRRGFPDRLRCPTRSFVEFGADVRQRFPTIRRVVIHCLNGWGERLAEDEGLQNLTELELACWYADEDMQALTSSFAL